MGIFQTSLFKLYCEVFSIVEMTTDCGMFQYFKAWLSNILWILGWGNFDIFEAASEDCFGLSFRTKFCHSFFGFLKVDEFYASKKTTDFEKVLGSRLSRQREFFLILGFSQNRKNLCSFSISLNWMKKKGLFNNKFNDAFSQYRIWDLFKVLSLLELLDILGNIIDWGLSQRNYIKNFSYFSHSNIVFSVQVLCQMSLTFLSQLGYRIFICLF